MESPQQEQPSAQETGSSAEQPLYEFSLGSEQKKESEPAALEIAPGLVYPPPPSYYQNMQLPAERPPLPEPRQQTPRTVEQPQPALPPNQWRPGYPPFAPQPGAPPYPYPYPSFPPGHYPPPAGTLRPKRSRRTVWTIVSIVSVIVLFSCALGSWEIYTFFRSAFQQVTAMTRVVDNFYLHVQQQSYAAAYADLQIDGLSADTFTSDAQNLDASNGVVNAYTSGIPTLSTATGNGQQWLIVVSVTRAQKSYSVPVTVTNINGVWKITDIDVNRF